MVGDDVINVSGGAGEPALEPGHNRRVVRGRQFTYRGLLGLFALERPAARAGAGRRGTRGGGDSWRTNRLAVWKASSYWLRAQPSASDAASLYVCPRRARE